MEATSTNPIDGNGSLTSQEMDELLDLFTSPDAHSDDNPKYKSLSPIPIDISMTSKQASNPASPNYVVAPPTPVGYTFGYNYPSYLAPNLQIDSPSDQSTVHSYSNYVPRRRNLASSFKNPQPTPIKLSLPLQLQNDRTALHAYIGRRLRIKMIRKGKVPPKCTLQELVESGCIDGKLRITSLVHPISVQPKMYTPSISQSRLLPKPE